MRVVSSGAIGVGADLEIPGEPILVDDVLRPAGTDVAQEGLRAAPAGGLGELAGLLEGIAEGASGDELPVEIDRELAGRAVVDRPGGGHHDVDPLAEQLGHLGAGRAAVEEDQLQAPLAAEVSRQPLGVGGRRPACRLQQQAVGVGVAGEVEDRHARAVPPEDLVDFGEA